LPIEPKTIIYVNEEQSKALMKIANEDDEVKIKAKAHRFNNRVYVNKAYLTNAQGLIDGLSLYY